MYQKINFNTVDISLPNLSNFNLRIQTNITNGIKFKFFKLNINI